MSARTDTAIVGDVRSILYGIEAVAQMVMNCGDRPDRIDLDAVMPVLLREARAAQAHVDELDVALAKQRAGGAA